MRFSVLLVLAVAGLTITSPAQKPQKLKTPPSHSEEKDKDKSTARAPRKEEAGRTSASQELRKVEQSSAKASGRKSTKAARTPRNTALVKSEKKDGNPPIHFGASGGGHKSSGKSKDALKGRMKHKGRR
jgi:hypothetical protein